MKPFHYFLVVAYITNFVIGFIGNLLVLMYLHDSLTKGKDFNKSLARILLSLAFADILTEIFGTVAILLEYGVLSHPEGALGDAVCKILTSHTMTWSFTNISILTVALLTWERYRAVTQFKSKASSADEEAAVIKYVIASFWFIGPVIYSPFIPFQIYDSDLGCYERFPNDATKYGIPLMDVVCFFVVPAIFFVFAYAKIVRSLEKPPMGMSTHQQRQFSYSKVRRQLTVTALLIVGTFFACWSAVYTIYTVRVICDLDNTAIDAAYKIAAIFAFFASTSHPIIYSFRSRHFRNKVRDVFSGERIESLARRMTPCYRVQRVEPGVTYVIRTTEETELESPDIPTIGELSNAIVESSSERDFNAS